MRTLYLLAIMTIFSADAEGTEVGYSFPKSGTKITYNCENKNKGKADSPTEKSNVEVTYTKTTKDTYRIEFKRSNGKQVVLTRAAWHIPTLIMTTREEDHQAVNERLRGTPPSNWNFGDEKVIRSEYVNPDETERKSPLKKPDSIRLSHTVKIGANMVEDPTYGKVVESTDHLFNYTQGSSLYIQIKYRPKDKIIVEMSVRSEDGSGEICKIPTQ